MQSYNPEHFQSAHLRWKAITQRDPTAHFAFLYGVKTTRIYCRPTCTARVARRANIVYYETPAQAQLEGFRPCIKCKPDDTTFIGQQEEIVLRTLGLLRDGAGNIHFEGGLKAMAKDVGVTPSYLCRVFKKTMGCTITQYIKSFEEMETSSTVRPPDGRNELAVSTGLSESLPVPVDPLEPAEVLPQNPNDHIALPSDLEDDFDFDEWLWTADMDIMDLTPAKLMSPSKGVCE